MNTFTSQVITIRPKRHRRRYNQIRENVRRNALERQEIELEHQFTLMKMVTYMSLIKSVLNIPLTEEEIPLVSNIILDHNPRYTQEMATTAMKYLNADFTPDKLYSIIARGAGYTTVSQWLRVRWGIIEFIEGRNGYDSITSDYYGFNNEDFFFDETRVVNPKGQNHTSWKLLPEPKAAVSRPEFPASTIELEYPTLHDWWASIKKFLKARNPG